MRRVLLFALSILMPLAGGSLQSVIDAAEPGSRIELPAGRFFGPITIDKPLILSGAGKSSVIDGNFSSKVITVLSSDVTIENIAIRNSGRQRHSLDSAVFVSGVKRVTIERCSIEDTLFGIILSYTADSVIKDNNISSYEESIVDNRGDGIRLWLSHTNLIEGNRLSKSRDLALMRSHHNVIRANVVKEGRYGILLQMCKDETIEKNEILSNYAGIFSSGSKDIRIRRNTIVKTHLATGVGILIRGGGRHIVRHNAIMRHAQAFYIDSSPAEKGMRRFIEYNRIALNNEAFHFHAIIKNNTIRNNTVKDNLTDVVKDIQHAKTRENDISMNYWDRYEGFDMDGDGIGDTPYNILIYADRLWQSDHHLKFFYATPLLSLIDFIERLAPFSEPLLLMRDEKPRLFPVEGAGVGEQRR
ncbi:nitrous oxide reductase family maturation protein NosD [Hydrogenimonas sp.]